MVSYGMCWYECWRESVCGVCVCDGKSGAVGLELGLIECSECRLLVWIEESEGKCDVCGAELWGEVT